ncbi:mitochondrial S-adenosylmethionine carrier protein isoform X2 [Stegostoma tigrinum]|uniref:mitochondrial S-adenosylmethionine carrier protein isoform X2 n=1 Tax=Stegostoma tigrinum TaxID=3053191 RepID=UPI00286FAF89|nr:mitochondrial S-adenosylmethionine carrier protein isoform X2 [Stegostoma tigrinum]
MMESREFLASLVAGGLAGMCVDLTLFPLDTMKTRLQSQQGFYNAGGFRGIYAGVPSAAFGSFPNAALFFVTYDYTKSVLGLCVSTKQAPLVHMVAASLGEMAACLIRVPSEVVKQRAQAYPSLGTYKVFLDTIRQEIPFALVQFPLWEFLKAVWSWKQNGAVDSWQAAVCGAFAGASAAAVTTPLDLAKTRIMLAKTGTTTASGKVLPVLKNIWKTQGISGILKPERVMKIMSSTGIYRRKGCFSEIKKSNIMAWIFRGAAVIWWDANSLEHEVALTWLLFLAGSQEPNFPSLFSGIVPRVTWISLGGFLFLGTYDKLHRLLL